MVRKLEAQQESAFAYIVSVHQEAFPLFNHEGMDVADGRAPGCFVDHIPKVPGGIGQLTGLGSKIKDDPAFQAEFVGEEADFSQANVFDIVKGGAPRDAEGKPVKDNQIDAITGATMTSQGLDAAIDTWLSAYAKYFQENASAKKHCGKCGHHQEGEEVESKEVEE